MTRTGCIARFQRSMKHYGRLLKFGLISEGEYNKLSDEEHKDLEQLLRLLEEPKQDKSVMTIAGIPSDEYGEQMI